MEPVYDYFANFGMPDPGTKILIGCVVSIMEDMIYIHKGTSFCLDTVCEGMIKFLGNFSRRGTIITHLALVSSS